MSLLKSRNWFDYWRTPLNWQVLLFFLFSLVLTPDRLAAANNTGTRPLYGVKIFDPDSKSYFELVDTQKEHPGNSGKWQGARVAAASRSFKGVRGRLAHVRSRATHDFLFRNFRPLHSAWIGLRYWCVDRKLRWTNGDIHQPRSFAPWHQYWAGTANRTLDLSKPIVQRTVPCVSGWSFMPVHYWGSKRGGNVWNAHSPTKGFGYFFVEYPTGEK